MEFIEFTYRKPRPPFRMPIPRGKPYPHLYADKIVSVQPLLGPTGLVYYLRHRYSNNKGNKGIK